MQLASVPPIGLVPVLVLLLAGPGCSAPPGPERGGSPPPEAEVRDVPPSRRGADDPFHPRQYGVEHAASVGLFVPSGDLGLESAVTVDGRVGINLARGRLLGEADVAYGETRTVFGSEHPGRILLVGSHLLWRFLGLDGVGGTTPYVGLGGGAIGLLDFEDADDDVGPGIAFTAGVDVDLGGGLSVRLEGRDWLFWSGFGPHGWGPTSALSLTAGLGVRF